MNGSDNSLYKNITNIKLNLLSNGLTIDESFLGKYDSGFIEKRWAYGNSDEVSYSKRIPQEIIIENIIVAVHCVESSPWKLVATDNDFFIYYEGQRVSRVSFPKRPNFYDEFLSDGTPCKSIGTLYGSCSLGIFALGTCYYFKIEKQCGFCSLEPTRFTHSEHVLNVTSEQSAELARIALMKDSNIIKQIMLNGGNRSKNDVGFLQHLQTLKKLCLVVEESGFNNDVEIHLITMPPDDLDLLERLRGLPVKVAMNLEVFSSELFNSIAPGKAALYGHKKLLEALEKAVEILGEGNVYTIFVGGLEPLDSLLEGLNFVSQKGIVPIINVFHRDPSARFAFHQRPLVSDIEHMGKELQNIFHKYKFKPFYKNCGRNSLDSEAYYGYFN